MNENYPGNDHSEIWNLIEEFNQELNSLVTNHEKTEADLARIAYTLVYFSDMFNDLTDFTRSKYNKNLNINWQMALSVTVKSSSSEFLKVGETRSVDFVVYQSVVSEIPPDIPATGELIRWDETRRCMLLDFYKDRPDDTGWIMLKSNNGKPNFEILDISVPTD